MDVGAKTGSHLPMYFYYTHCQKTDKLLINRQSFSTISNEFSAPPDHPMQTAHMQIHELHIRANAM